MTTRHHKGIISQCGKLEAHDGPHCTGIQGQAGAPSTCSREESVIHLCKDLKIPTVLGLECNPSLSFVGREEDLGEGEPIYFCHGSCFPGSTPAKSCNEKSEPGIQSRHSSVKQGHLNLYAECPVLQSHVRSGAIPSYCVCV